MEEGTNKNSNGILGATLGATTIGTILIVMFVGK
jgi:hypothetical protein